MATLLVALTLAILGRFSATGAPTSWAILVAGYDYYTFSYGFEAALCKHYRLLKMRGVKEENIIVISPDTVAYHPKNPVPGWIGYGVASNETTFSAEDNVYDGVRIDYDFSFITSELFYELMKGNETAFRAANVTNPKVLKSRPKDTVYMYWIGLGGYGVFTLTNRQYIWAEQFVPFLEKLAEERRFGKLFLHVEVGYGGSSYDDYIDTNKQILVLTTRGRYDEISVCHYNGLLRAYTSTCTAYEHWRHLNEMLCNSKRGTDSVFDLFSNLSKRSDLPAANLYGKMAVGKLSLRSFYGRRARCDARDFEPRSVRRCAQPSQISMTKAFVEDESLTPQEKLRLDGVMRDIVDKSAAGRNLAAAAAAAAATAAAAIDRPPVRLSTPDNRRCYREAFGAVRTRCFTEKNGHMVFGYANALATLCESNVAADRIVRTAEQLCGSGAAADAARLAESQPTFAARV